MQPTKSNPPAIRTTRVISGSVSLQNSSTPVARSVIADPSRRNAFGSLSTASPPPSKQSLARPTSPTSNSPRKAAQVPLVVVKNTEVAPAAAAVGDVGDLQFLISRMGSQLSGVEVRVREQGDAFLTEIAGLKRSSEVSREECLQLCAQLCGKAMEPCQASVAAAAAHSQERWDKLQEELHELRASQAKLPSMLERLERLEQQSGEHFNAECALRQSVQELRAEVASNHAAGLAELGAQVGSTNEALDVLTKGIDELRASLASAVRKDALAQELESCWERVEEAGRSAAKEQEAMRADVEDLKAVARELDQRGAVTEELLKTTLDADRRSHGEAIEGLRSSIKELKANTTSSADDLANSVSFLRTTLADLASRSDLESQRDALAKDAADLRDRLDGVRVASTARSDDLERRIGVIAEELGGAAKCTDFEAHQRSLAEELESHRRSCAEGFAASAEEASRLSTDMAELQKSLTEVAQKADMEAHDRTTATKIAGLTEQLGWLQSSSRQAAEELVKQASAELSKRLDDVRDALATTVKPGEMQVEIKNLAAKLEGLQAKSKQATDELALSLAKMSSNPADAASQAELDAHKRSVVEGLADLTMRIDAAEANTLGKIQAFAESLEALRTSAAEAATNADLQAQRSEQCEAVESLRSRLDEFGVEVARRTAEQEAVALSVAAPQAAVEALARRVDELGAAVASATGEEKKVAQLAADGVADLWKAMDALEAQKGQQEERLCALVDEGRLAAMNAIDSSEARCLEQIGDLHVAVEELRAHAAAAVDEANAEILARTPRTVSEVQAKSEVVDLAKDAPWSPSGAAIAEFKESQGHIARHSAILMNLQASVAALEEKLAAREAAPERGDAEAAAPTSRQEEALADLSAKVAQLQKHIDEQVVDAGRPNPEAEWKEQLEAQARWIEDSRGQAQGAELELRAMVAVLEERLASQEDRRGERMTELSTRVDVLESPRKRGDGDAVVEMRARIAALEERLLAQTDAALLAVQESHAKLTTQLSADRESHGNSLSEVHTGLQATVASLQAAVDSQFSVYEAHKVNASEGYAKLAASISEGDGRLAELAAQLASIQTSFENRTRESREQEEGVEKSQGCFAERLTGQSTQIEDIRAHIAALKAASDDAAREHTDARAAQMQLLAADRAALTARCDELGEQLAEERKGREARLEELSALIKEGFSTAEQKQADMLQTGLTVCAREQADLRHMVEELRAEHEAKHIAASEAHTTLAARLDAGSEHHRLQLAKLEDDHSMQLKQRAEQIQSATAYCDELAEQLTAERQARRVSQAELSAEFKVQLNCVEKQSAQQLKDEVTILQKDAAVAGAEFQVRLAALREELQNAAQDQESKHQLAVKGQEAIAERMAECIADIDGRIEEHASNLTFRFTMAMDTIKEQGSSFTMQLHERTTGLQKRLAEETGALQLALHERTGALQEALSDSTAEAGARLDELQTEALHQRAALNEGMAMAIARMDDNHREALTQLSQEKAMLEASIGNVVATVAKTHDQLQQRIDHESNALQANINHNAAETRQLDQKMVRVHEELRTTIRSSEQRSEAQFRMLAEDADQRALAIAHNMEVERQERDAREVVVRQEIEGVAMECGGLKADVFGLRALIHTQAVEATYRQDEADAAAARDGLLAPSLVGGAAMTAALLL